LETCHPAQAAGSPALAVAWQSEEADAGALQLVLQKADKSPQLWSGIGFDGDAVVPESGWGGVDMAHALRRTAWSCAAQLNIDPPTQVLCPHAIVR
jgi:hypothetical protein